MEGLLIPLITPFAKDGSVALDALEELAHRVLDDGAAGLVPLGTTGEPATLTAAEKNAVMDTVAAVCRDRGALLIAGAGSNDTAGSVEAVKALAKWPEVTAALTVVPYYTRPGEAGVVAHFTRLAAESPVPLMLYNIPYRTGQVLGWQALRQLAAVPGIVGMKQAVGAVDEDTVRLMADKPESFAVFAGDDLYVSPLLALGAAGGILASPRTSPPTASPRWSAPGGPVTWPAPGCSAIGWRRCRRRCSPSRTRWWSRRCCTPKGRSRAQAYACHCCRPVPRPPKRRCRRTNRVTAESRVVKISY
ncbi:dihydrodipicolinate synthase family protein [Fodinicola feengrottensis]